MSDMEEKKTIVVHKGNFHADDALCCAMLQLLPEYHEAEIIRTTDPAIIEKSTIVCDVGGIYDASILRFDHHQKGYMEIFGGKSAGIKMAASGLIYRHFGKRLLTTIYPNLAEDEFSLNIAYNKLYSRLIKEVDAEDNGIDPWSGVEGFKPLYSTHTNLGARVGMLNVWWCEDYSQEKENTRFMEAVEICRTELLSQMKWVVENFLPARKIVQEAYAKREGPIMIIEGKCGPWKEHLFEIEAEAKAEEPVLNVVSFDRGRQQWNCICVPDSPQSFGLRLGFPPEWRGLRNEELEKVSGIKGTVFTHASGFMGSNETKEGAIEMARRSAELQKDKMPEVMQLFKSTRDLYAST